MAEVESKETCEECTQNEATCRCEKCGSKFCEECFDEIHHLKSLRKHQKSALSSNSRVPFSPAGICDTHQKPVEYFCQKDDQLICSTCLIFGVHKDHPFITLAQNNEDNMEKLKSLFEKAQLIKKKHEQQQKSNQEAYNKNYEKMMDAFILLQVKLEESKYVFRSQLEESYNDHGSTLVGHESVDLVNKLQEELQKASRIIHNLNSPIDSQLVIQELESLVHTCQQIKEPVIFYNYSLVEKMSLLLATSVESKKIEPTKEEVALAVKEEPATAVIDPSPEEPIVAPSQEISVEESTEDKIPNSIDTYIKQEPLALNEAIEVVVTRADSPLKFYVQRPIGSLYATNLFFKTIQTFYEKNKAHSHFLCRNPVKDQACVVQYSNDKIWYRAQVRSKNKYFVSVDLVDYGHSVKVLNSALRKINKKFLLQPALAFRCLLEDFAVEWLNDNICSKFTTLVKNKLVQLTPLNLKTDASYEVSIAILEDEEFVDLKETLLDEIEEEAQSSDEDIGTEEAEEIETDAVEEIDTDEEIIDTEDEEIIDMDGDEIIDIDEEKATEVDFADQLIPVTITSVSKPSNLTVKFSSEAKSQACQEFMASMQKFYQNCPPEPLDIFEHILYAALGICSNKWHRVMVVKSTPDGHYEVEKVDDGQKETVEFENIRVLDKQFKGVETFAFKCHLQDPCTSAALKYLEQCKEEEKIIYLRYLGNFNYDSIPVELYELEQEEIDSSSGGATGQFISLTDVLVKQGIELLSPLSVLNPEIFAKENIAYKEAAILKELYFSVRPTHLDCDWNVHVQRTSDADLLQEILAELRLRVPSYDLGCTDMQYSLGQACVAKNNLDNRWYRAEVVSSHQDGFEVELVDYGNRMFVTNLNRNLFPHVVCSHIPKQAYRFHIFNITKKKNWSASTIEYIQATIIGKSCKVMIKEKTVNGSPVVVSLFLLEGDLLADLVRDFEENLENKEEEEKSESCLGSAFLTLQLESLEFFNGVVSYAFSQDQSCYVYLQREEVLNPSTRQHYSINENYAQFFRIIQVLEDNQCPPLDNVAKSQVCCALSNEFDGWYRAKVENIKSDLATLLFIDYGSTEEVPVEKLRVLPPELLKIPAQAILCRLYNVESVGPDPMVSERLKEALGNHSFVVTVKYLDTIPEIELLTESGRLAYEQLFNNRTINKKCNYLPAGAVYR